MSNKPKTLADLGFADITPPESETNIRRPFENIKGELSEILRAFQAGEITSEEARSRARQVRENQKRKEHTEQ